MRAPLFVPNNRIVVPKSFSTSATPRFHYTPIGVLTQGDSITNQGPSAPYYPTILTSTFLAANFGSLTNNGITGQTFANMAANAQTVDYPVMATALANGWIATASCFGGTNDINAGTTGATTFGFATSYFGGIKQYGKAKLCIGWTILPRTGSSATETANFNTLMRANYLSIGCDWLVDVAADPTMGNSGAPANTSLYTDGTHPTGTTGMTILATYLYAVLMSINSTTQLTSVSPSSGAHGSTNTLTFTGLSGFTGATQVVAGGLQCTGVTVNSDTSITATVPAAIFAGTGPCWVVSPTGASILPASYTFT